MTATTTPRVRKARRSSRCPLCNGWISTGQLITYRAGEWVHARCVLPAAPSGVDASSPPTPETSQR
jgi:hypothetical protein